MLMYQIKLGIKSAKELSNKTLQKIQKGLKQSNLGNVKSLGSFKKYYDGKI